MLQVTDGDIPKAAKRMANYWMNREYFFGDRWLLPMTQVCPTSFNMLVAMLIVMLLTTILTVIDIQTGTGCLSREDIEVLRMGFMVVVTMENDRQVLFTDASRLHGAAGFSIRERLIYYITTSVLTDRSRCEGIDLVCLVAETGLANNERFAELMERIHSSCPFKARSFTTVPAVDAAAGKEHLLDYFAFVMVKTHQVVAPGATAVEFPAGRLLPERMPLDILPNKESVRRICQRTMGAVMMSKVVCVNGFACD